MARKDRPQTTDHRYLVSRGVLKRCTDPSLADSDRRKAVKALMQARMAKDPAAVLKAKVALGEAGPVWWDDGTPDYSGSIPADTPYADWWQTLSKAQQDQGM